MALFNRQKSSDVPPELQPYYDGPANQRRGWIWLVARIVILLVILFLLVLLGHWLWDKAHNNQSTPVTSSTSTSTPSTTGQANSGNGGTSGQSSTGSANTNASSGQAAQTPNGSARSSASSSSSSTSSTSNTGSASSQLTDTGPGNLVAVFGVSTVISILLYQGRLRLRRSGD